MSIEITIVATSVEDLRNQISGLYLSFGSPIPVANGGTGTATPEPEVTKPAPKKTTKPKADEVKEEPAPAAEPETAKEEPAPAEQPAEALDFDKDVAPVVLKVVAEKSRDRVTEILSQFGVARASELDETRWPELIKTLQAELA